MFSKTFFSRLKHASDVTIITGSGMVKTVSYPQTGTLDFRNTASIERQTGQSALTELATWVASVKPTLGHYALVDMDKKISNLNILTTTADSLHLKAGNENTMELNGNFSNANSLRFLNEDVEKSVMDKAIQASAECEVFILCGVELLDPKIESLPFMAKGNGCYMAEIAEAETEMSRHCNEKIYGDVADWLLKLSMIINKVF